VSGFWRGFRRMVERVGGVVGKGGGGGVNG